MQPIETPRLIIRPFVAADINAVVQFQDDCFGASPRSEREAWLAWTIGNYSALAQLRQPPYGDYAIELKESGAVIGSVGLVPSFGPFKKLPWFLSRLSPHASDLFTPEMGLFWAVHSNFRRMGYATEATRALAHFAFHTLKVERLVGTTERSNMTSMGVMQKIGMTIETNPDSEPEWFQVVGILLNPTAHKTS